MYEWRKMTPKEREEALSLRKTRKQPWHSPPHWIVEGEHTYIVSAACFDHAPIIGFSPGRMAECEETLLTLCAEFCLDTFAWCVLPNHYHLVVRTERIADLRKGLGRFHGRSSRAWNLEEKRTGRKVWFNCFERGMKSERHYFATLNYVHHNPVKHGYVEKWADWPFSSGREFVERLGREEAERIWLEYPILDYGKGWDDF
jgi:putative transposase